MKSKIEITWAQDSYGQESVHVNGPKMSLKESYLGHLQALDTPDGRRWHYFLKGTEKPFGPFENYGEARKALMLEVISG